MKEFYKQHWLMAKIRARILVVKLRRQFKNIYTWIIKDVNRWVISLGSAAALCLTIAFIAVMLTPTTPKDTDTKRAAATLTINSQVGSTVNNSNAIDPQTADTTMKWVKSANISDNDLPVDGSITEEIDENQVFVGDIFLPKGWTAEYSTDPRGTPKAQRSFTSYNMANQSSNPLSAITYLKINTGSADGVKPYSEAPLVGPLSPQQLITDGKAPSSPILYENKLYVVIKGMRAATAGSYTLDCFDLVTHARCVGIGNANFFPTYLSTSGASATNPTALGTGAKDISTALNFQHVMDDGTYGHNGRVYIPGQSGNNYGVVCFDLESYQNCGFTTLGSASAPTGANPSWLNGFTQSGSKIYGHANDPDNGNQTVVCFDIRDPGNGGGICSGYTASTTAATQTQYTYEHSNNYDTPGSQVMDGDKLYWIVNYRYNNTRLYGAIFPWDPYPNTQRDHGTVLTCFNVVTRTTCSGIYSYNWPRVYDGSAGDIGIEYASAMFMWQQTGANIAVCYTFSNVSLNSSPVESRVICHRLSDGAFMPNTGAQAPNVLPVPSVWQGPNILGSTAWRMASNTTTITDANSHRKTYFAYHYGNNATRGATSCFDWNTQANCAGMPWLKYWYNINNAVSGDEGYAYDGSCMYGVNRQGFLWSFNPTTAESPCRAVGTTQTASFVATDFYCDGQSHAFGWQGAKLSKASMYDFKDYNLKVFDTNGGTMLGSGAIKNSGKLDLTGGAYSGQTSLFLQVDSTVWNSSPWANGNVPFAKVQANADDVQYCYKTRAKTYAEQIACDVSTLQTTSDAVFNAEYDTLTNQQPDQIGFIQQSDKQCFKDLSIAVSADKTLVKNAQNVTYSITVQNKANTDAQGRGNIPSAFNTQLARYEATIPTGMQFVSASPGGTQVGNKVVWENQSIAASSVVPVSVTLQAPPSIASKLRSPVTLAASEQSVLGMNVTAIYNGDVYQGDNNATNNQVTFENNAQPAISDLQQTVVNPKEPSDLRFTVLASDDDQLSSVVLLEGGNVIGTMAPTGMHNQYGITLNNRTRGTYSFSARATDNGDPALSRTTGPLGVIVTPPDPPAGPTNSNDPPSVFNFEQKNIAPRAPADLSFTVGVTDDTGLASVELYQGDTKVGTMTPGEEQNSYTITVKDYDAGSYGFRVRATDNGTPALFTLSDTLTVKVGNQATQGNNNTTPNRNQSASDSSTSPNLLQKLASPLASTGFSATVLSLAKNVASPFSPRVAKLLPYTTIGLLIIFAVAYAYLALQQYRTKHKISLLLQKYQQTDTVRRTFLDLASHYLSTPLATMQNSLELIAKESAANTNTIESARFRLGKLAEHAKTLLDRASMTNQTAIQTSGILQSIKESKILSSTALLIPLATILAAVILVNVLFLMSNKYDASLVGFVSQIGLYVLAGAALVFAYAYLQQQKLAAQAAEQQLTLEDSLNNSQRDFIHTAGTQLVEDVNSLDTVTKTLSKAAAGTYFVNGLIDLKQLAARFQFLDNLSTGSPAKAKAIQLDVSTKQAIAQHAKTAKDKQVSIDVAADPLLEAMIDHEAYQRLLGSLVDNAIKFSPEGGKVTVKLSGDRRYVTLSVSDQGEGISEDKLQNFAKPFVRGTDTREFDYQGMGLDLYIDRLIIDKWNGELDIASHKGTGTTVTAKLRRSYID